jgi:RNA polymerase sigma-70 factor (sigma-E family)
MASRPGRTQARDTEFTAFVGAHRPGLLRTAALLTAGDAHRAEDLVQTGLTKLYVAWPSVRREGNPLAYARRTIVNAHIDETRRPTWRRERVVAEPPDAPTSDWDPLGGVDGETVRAALRALPPRMRAAIVLRHWLDLSVEETAALLGCTPGTVKSTTSKGLARLREHLERPATASTERTAS